MHSFLRPLKLLSTTFHAHVPTFDSSQKILPVGLRGIFVQNSSIFFFSKEFSICLLDHYICYIKVFMQKHRYWNLVKILDQSDKGARSYKIGTNYCFFVSFQRIFHFFLGPLNVQSTSFHAHTPTLDSGQNSWPIKPWGIFVKKLLGFYFFCFLFF